MKSTSRTLILLASAFALAAATFETVHTVAQKRWQAGIERAMTAFTRARDWAIDVFVSPLRALMRTVRAWLVLAALPKLTAARQYVRREVESARIFATWRMCPST